MDPVVHAVGAVALLAAGAVATVSMLRLFGGAVEAAARERTRRVHLWSGRLFALLALLLVVSMLAKTRAYPDFTPLQTSHLVLGLALVPLVPLKMAIARAFKSQHKMLPAFGIVLLTIAALVVFTGLLAMARAGAPDAGAALPRNAPPAFERYCGQCHALSRPLSRAAAGGMDASAWRALIARMEGYARDRGASVWLPQDAQAIADFLAGGAAPGAAGGAAGEDDHGRGRGRGRGGD